MTRNLRLSIFAFGFIAAFGGMTWRHDAVPKSALMLATEVLASSDNEPRPIPAQVERSHYTPNSRFDKFLGGNLNAIKKFKSTLV